MEWKAASKPKSQVYGRIRFFRDIEGQYEDKYSNLMKGPGEMVEGDGMFEVGKRKYDVGR